MKFLRPLADRRNPHSLSSTFRRKRGKHLTGLLACLHPPITILDVGGEASFWETVDVARGANIVLLNMALFILPGLGLADRLQIQRVGTAQQLIHLSRIGERKVAAALDQLPLKLRAPLVLFEIEEWSYETIARALGCRIGTVKSRISRARKLMRAELESWWIGGNDDGRTDWQGPAATAASRSVATLQV